LPPTSDAPKAPKAPKAPRPAVNISFIAVHDKQTELKFKLTGELAAAFEEYHRAAEAVAGKALDHGFVASQMIAKHIEADKGFAAWRKANPEKAA